jgi:hypothetical protein
MQTKHALELPHFAGRNLLALTEGSKVGFRSLINLFIYHCHSPSGRVLTLESADRRFAIVRPAVMAEIMQQGFARFLPAIPLRDRIPRISVMAESLPSQDNEGPQS